ncbi:O-antigen ligase family protein [Candidatus Nitrospira allomarina]|uniref:O-antigen ligase family protein n=1 Tax=Candidatus Nitrospira allomarina TaxID=3020900 RepID=A0AA96JSK5_9BACT|nr:O-antigen ligase family protein [Candidatus Nitrospira allomarina]WNM58155.1 O-antigen ligase family protein [Candidatus Nitrospira allomarina]
MSTDLDVGQVGSTSSSRTFSRSDLWPALGWGLCVVILLGFSPRLFHIQEYFYFPLLGLAILLCVLERKPLWIHAPLLVPFICFVGWVAFTIPFSIDPWISLKEWQKIVAQLAVFYGTCLIVQEQRNEYFLRKALPVLLVGAIACYSYSLLDFWDRGGNLLDRTIRAGYPKEGGADFTWLSTNVLMVFPLFITGFLAVTSPWKRVMLGCGMLLSFLALVLSYSRGVWLACLAQLIVGGFLVHKRQVFCSLMIGMVVFLSVGVVLGQLGLHRETFNPWTIKARLAVWNLSAADIVDHPIVGVGYGVPILEKRHGQNIVELEAVNLGIPDIPEKPHNWYLMVVTGAGIPGLVLFLWLLAKVGFTIYEDWTKAMTSSYRWLQMGVFLMVLGFSIRIFFEDSFGGSHSYLFWILVGTSVVLSNSQVSGKCNQSGDRSG